MAIDCYLSHLYFKWRDIEELGKFDTPYDPVEVEKQILKELRAFRDFLDKAKAVANIMRPPGVVDFISSHPELKSEIAKGSPSIDINAFLRCVRDQVMWKRNNIIHVGKYKYHRDDAIKALNYAELLIKVLEKMDEIRSRA
ncbi:MAG: hypothetical protein ACFFCW_48650, partial [Candidatus Hodarchaeota archaeon]